MYLHTRSPFLVATFWLCMVTASSAGAQPQGWTATGAPAVSRSAGHRTVLLANGKVLNLGGGVSTVEIYDPVTGQWSATASMGIARLRPIALRLINGKVLVAGGTGDNSAELYDPVTGMWSATGSLNQARQTAAGVLLADGRVLITGGTISRLAEIYDPNTGVWSSAGTMTAVRFAGTNSATLTSTILSDGRVLAVGGSDSSGALRSAELFNPVTGIWTATGSLSSGRFNHSATLLPNGKVLVTGGSSIIGNVCPVPTQSTELYDPATEQWSANGNLANPRAGHTTVLTADGQVLVVGGNQDTSCFARSTSEIYGPATGGGRSAGDLDTVYIPLHATLLANRKVLAVGSGASLFDSGAPGLSVVSAASFAASVPVATESIATITGADLAAGTQAAMSSELPAQLAGTSVKVRDRMGVERSAPLLFVSPTQINYQIPPGTAVGGLAAVTVTRGGVLAAAGVVEIATVVPGIFTFNSSGSGVPAALAFRIKADGTQQYEPVARVDPGQSTYVPQPIDLGSANDNVFLILYGTGIRFWSSSVIATIGGVSSEVLYAGAAPGFVGLDQVNLRLPRSLAGLGQVSVTLTVDGVAANSVLINVR
jgi:uncharacterized protein (TIGR03437 family)